MTHIRTRIARLADVRVGAHGSAAGSMDSIALQVNPVDGIYHTNGINRDQPQGEWYSRAFRVERRE